MQVEVLQAGQAPAVPAAAAESVHGRHNWCWGEHERCPQCVQLLRWALLVQDSARDLQSQARHWQQQHQQERQRSARYGASIQDLVARNRELRLDVEHLRKEKADLERRCQDLLKKPFGRSSEKHPRGKDQPTSPPESGSGGPAVPGLAGQAGAGGGQSPSGTGAEDGKQRARGGQPGAAPHGRVQRPGLPRREEVLLPEADRCLCGRCGLPFARNGETVTERVEIEVKGHVRRIRRPRLRAVCKCPQASGQEVVAELEPALFRGSNYGLSVWTVFLIQVYWQRRPARAFEREWGEFGVRLPISTLLGHCEAFLTWFGPLVQAIAAHQRTALVAHGDETSWVVHALAEQGGNRRCWLWACLTADAVRLRVDPSRSAEAAAELFGDLGRGLVLTLVCDRYSAYLRLAREHEGQIELAYCWSHVRRDYWDLRKRQRLREWADGIIERIGELYALNRQRLQVWDASLALDRQGPQFQRVQRRLELAAAALFELARREVAEFEPEEKITGWADRRLKPQRSLLKHQKGLEVFLRKPWVPMDNNAIERQLRRPVVGRKLSHGSHSRQGAQLQATLLSVFGTLDMHGICLQDWLTAYLRECAAVGPKACPIDPHKWLPWGMPQQRLRALQAPLDHRGRAP